MNRGMAQPRTPLLPVGVSNRATMPKPVQHYMAMGEEILAVVNVAPDSSAGQIVYNSQIGPNSCARLSKLSDLWQRIDWDHTVLNIVALNGSVTGAGYNVGFLEDPEFTVPTDASTILPFLTSLRGTSVRQNWVQSETGQSVTLSKLPEMYTTLGADIRRYYIGRLVMALTGDVGPAGASFQILLRYRVKLYVPCVTLVQPLTGSRPFTGTQTLVGPTQTAVPSVQFVSSSAPIPPIGVYRLQGDAFKPLIVTNGLNPTNTTVLRVAGFEVLGGVGTTMWTNYTRFFTRESETRLTWPNNDIVGATGAYTWCSVTPLVEAIADTEVQGQIVFSSADVFDFTNTAANEH